MKTGSTSSGIRKLQKSSGEVEATLRWPHLLSEANHQKTKSSRCRQLGLLISLAAAACGESGESEESNTESEAAEQAVAKNCKIGSTSVSHLADGSKDCKDAVAFAKITENLGKPVRAMNTEYLYEGDSVLSANFMASGSGSTYSMYLQATADGNGFLQVDDLNAGATVLQHTVQNGGFAEEGYFRNLSISQSASLTNAIGETIIRRMHGGVGRLLGGAKPGATTCLGDCATRFCRFTSAVAQRSSVARLPSLGTKGGEAEGKVLLDACTKRGPTILASGTYCCKTLTVASTNKDGKKVYRGMGCALIDPDRKDGNSCNSAGATRVTCVGETFGNGNVEDCTAN